MPKAFKHKIKTSKTLFICNVMEAKDYYRVKITKIISETAKAASFVLEAQDGWKPIYKPGQFLTLVFFTMHGEKRRSYSISSSPACNEALTITVKKIANGEFSRWLVDEARAGDILYCSGIGGQFILPGDDKIFKAFYFYAAGSGITPCFSLLKTLLVTTKNSITLFYSNRSLREAIFHEDLEALAKKYAHRFSIYYFFSNIMHVEKGRMSFLLLQEKLSRESQFEKSLNYICGPWAYMQLVTFAISRVSTNAKIIKENFSTLPRLTLPKPPDTEAHQVTIHYRENMYNITVQYPDNILSAALKNNIMLPYSCRAGRCSSCMATCTSGKIWMAYNEVLVDEEIEKGRILTCQGYPVENDAVIRFD
ncbi:MAG: iron-sulfur cluster-binding domain-containing protein [Ferruginibacter sp.]